MMTKEPSMSSSRDKKACGGQARDRQRAGQTNDRHSTRPHTANQRRRCTVVRMSSVIQTVCCGCGVRCVWGGGL